MGKSNIEGNGFFTPRIVESWMFIPIHSLKIWIYVLIEDWPTGDWLTTDQPHDGGLRFYSMEAGDHNQPDSHPENKHGTHMEPLYIGFGDVWRCLESWVHGFHIIFARGAPCSHLTRTLCGIAAVFIFGSAAARVSAPVSPDGPWPHPFCK